MFVITEEATDAERSGQEAGMVASFTRRRKPNYSTYTPWSTEAQLQSLHAFFNKG